MRDLYPPRETPGIREDWGEEIGKGPKIRVVWSGFIDDRYAAGLSDGRVVLDYSRHE